MPISRKLLPPLGRALALSPTGPAAWAAPADEPTHGHKVITASAIPEVRTSPSGVKEVTVYVWGGGSGGGGASGGRIRQHRRRTPSPHRTPPRPLRHHMINRTSEANTGALLPPSPPIPGCRDAAGFRRISRRDAPISVGHAARQPASCRTAATGNAGPELGRQYS